jgi:hypothetical protein
MLAPCKSLQSWEADRFDKLMANKFASGTYGAVCDYGGKAIKVRHCQEHASEQPGPTCKTPSTEGLTDLSDTPHRLST